MSKNQNNADIAVVGNPNCGKSSLFNALTGLNQKVGNFPGVTVDKKTGMAQLEKNISVSLIDLPGSYSLYPRREDEWVTYNVLMENDAAKKPHIVLLVMDASNLKRNLLYCSQLIDLNYKVVVAMTMGDIAAKKGIKIDTDELSIELGVPVVPVNPRTGKGLEQLKKVLLLTIEEKHYHHKESFIDIDRLTPVVKEAQQIMPDVTPYTVLHTLIHTDAIVDDAVLKNKINAIKQQSQFNETKIQAQEVLQRYQKIQQIVQNTLVEPDPLRKKIFTEKIDNILLHRVWGYIVLLAVVFVLFQCIYWVASYPMDLIDEGFSALTSWVGAVLPESWWSDLLVNGVLAGIGGIIIFLPQIMILFGLIGILEDTGYMARISFLMDKLMRKVGLNGKSVMPMISGFACAIPAVMSARNIENKKERLLTILITPLMSCSARLPVYIILIALVIPNTYIGGFISLQGLVMMGLYLLGFVTALLVSYVLKFFIKIKEKSYFILELPVYKVPRWKNIFVTMVEKGKIFLIEAGKIIMIISIIIWLLSSYGPSARMNAVDQKYEAAMQGTSSDPEEIQKNYASEKLENSYAGILGKAIEPSIEPLGFDWKIGIAIITSFAAREVFVGTMATLYSADETNEATLREKMDNAVRADGTKLYTSATGLSLMIFYVFAMQCMSTLAIVRRETGTWKWPLFQLFYMTSIAYVLSFIVYRAFV